MKRLARTPILAVVVLGACTAANPGEAPIVSSTPGSIATTTTSTSSTTTRPPPLLSPEAEGYLLEAIDIMQTWSINRGRVDWPALEAAAFRIADGSETAADTYPAIEASLQRLADDHSVFLTPSETRLLFDGEARFDEPEVEVGVDGIGRVVVGLFRGNIGEQADEYARTLATRLNEASRSVCGWIVDLRDNPGGNMWPMVAGLAPILGEGEIGSFTYPDGAVEPWRLEDGVAWWDQEPMTSYQVAIPDEQLPVAVLIGRETASSGEATAIAFRGRADTRFFGGSTAGLTTSNEPLYLSDGALLALTMSVFTDRTGDTFGQDIPVMPDEPSDDPASDAADWLTGQGECAGE